MSLLHARGLAQRHGYETIFAGIDCSIPTDARIALVGANGSGKSSLLRILTGEDEPSAGHIQRARLLRLGYLPQEFAASTSDHSLFQEQLRAFPDLLTIQEELRALERALESNTPITEHTLRHYGERSAEFEARGGYRYEHEIRRVLSGLGFGPADYERPLSQLSGGQQTRAALARLLLEAPMLLVLDEPTNHLDIAALAWLENYLSNYNCAILLVSHDRQFMDAFASEIWELEGGQLTRYRGNFSHYRTQRDAHRERQLKVFSAQQVTLRRDQEFIRKHLGSRLTAQARGRQKRLRTLTKRGGLIQAPRRERAPRFSFAGGNRSGDEVLMTHNLVVGYDEAAPLLRLPDVTLLRGETAAILGPNGSGKTTLLRTLLGEIPPLKGALRFGVGSRIGYLEQARAALHDEETLLEALLAAKHMPISAARDELGRFGFSGDDVFRAVATLSGGERSRFALTLLAQTAANCWLLDEPTNHLDVPSQEHLQRALADFDGTTLLVSHDRFLIAALATQIWEARAGTPRPQEMGEGEVRIFASGYAEYLAKQTDPHSDRSAKPASPPLNPPPSRQALSAYQRQRRLVELEATIAQIEEQQAELEARIASASTDGDVKRVRELGKAHARQAAKLQRTFTEWERISE